MTMIPIFLSILIGIAVGYLIRQKRIVKYTAQLLNGVIVLLLFVLGIAVGSNEQLVAGFTSLGIEALLLTIGATLCSLVAAKFLYIKVFHRFNHNSSQRQTSYKEEE